MRNSFGNGTRIFRSTRAIQPLLIKLSLIPLLLFRYNSRADHFDGLNGMISRDKRTPTH